MSLLFVRTRRVPVLIAAGVVVLLALVITPFVAFGGDSSYRITARFVATPGLYAHNGVDILGVPKGHIVSIKAKSTYVEVVLSLPRKVKVPANVSAVMVAPNPVSDRFVELTPPYTGGAALAPDATIPLERTVVPLELDQVYDSVDNLSRMLGPTGANQGGELSGVLHAFAGLANGNGADVHTTITTIAAALPALTAHPDQLANLVNGLDTLTRTLATRNSTINALYDDLATATGQLADERATIASAVANLQSGLAQVSQFLQANRANLRGSIANLSTTLSAVLAEQKALIQTFDTAPLGFQNFNRAIDLTTACPTPTGAPNNCPGLWARVDLTQGAFDTVRRYCGDSVVFSLVPIALSSARLTPAQAVYTACGAEFGLLQNRSGSPGAPATPDLDLSHSLGRR